MLVGGDSRGPEKKEGIEGVYPGVGKEVFQGEVVNPDVGKGVISGGGNSPGGIRSTTSRVVSTQLPGVRILPKSSRSLTSCLTGVFE